MGIGNGDELSIGQVKVLQALMQRKLFWFSATLSLGVLELAS
jgi:hypothetical protein